ncbi:MAG: phosphodiester glycosidase family protein [Bacilli bacterium]
MKKKKKKTKKTGIILLLIADIIIAICFFLTYGPIKYFRDFLITTSMTTMTHKYLAKTFYSEKTINKTLSENKVEGFDKGTDTSQITFGGKEPTTYASIYEEQILKRKKGESYKLIEFEYNGFHCYLTAIYEPKKVGVASTEYLGTRGETLVDISKKYNAKIAINAGGFYDPNGNGSGGMPMGPVIENKKLVWGDMNTKFEMVGIDKNNVLVLENMTAAQALNAGIRDAVQFGPFLIVNGESAKITVNGGWLINPRTAIAQRKDVISLFLIIDGHGQNKYNWNGRGGVTLNQMIEILERYGAYNAANMDGGASTTLTINNVLTNKPCGLSSTGERWLPNAWILK